MLIDCPACARSYHVNPADIEGGRTVICPRCDARWFADSLAASPAFAALPAPGADARGAAARLMPMASRRIGFRVPRTVGLGLASLALVSLTICARATIVNVVPRSAAIFAAAGLPINLRGLALVEVRIARVDPSSPEVTVSGEIRNVAGRRVRVPRIAFEVRDGAGQALIRWSERPPARLVAAGRTLVFASSRHAVPPESRTVLVHFEDVGDAS